MRIISGKYKGKTIPAPKSIEARPTTDYAKTALFNILEHRLDFEELEVLDLFSGTGSIGFEFLSRGAKSVIAVDQHHMAANFANEFAGTLGYEKQYKAYRNECLRALKQVNKTFDIVFCDPPYSFPKHDKLVQSIIENNLVKPGGLLIVEHGSKTSLETQPFFTEVRKYGNVLFSFFEIPLT